MPSRIDLLYDSLQRRLRPEDVAELVLAELDDDLDKDERKLLRRAATGSLKRGIHQITSMAQDFARPVPPLRQARKAGELFASAYPLSDADCADLDTVRAFVRHISAEIRKVPEESDFKANRLNSEERRQRGLDLSRRRYNKLFRFLGRFEAKLDTYATEQRKYRAGRIAKSGLAVDITRADFAASRDAACFVAYFTARRNRRSVFTNKGQDRAFDDLAAVLLARFGRRPSAAGWRAVAHVMADTDVVRHLAAEEKMALFGAWLATLAELAGLLQTTWQKSHFDRATMIVRRGDDSSTWNALAGAWNEARRSWLSLLQSLGMEGELEALCFGKVMRLMAADVARWHVVSGGTLEPDTLVWAALPPPWEVFAGERSCSKADIEAACRAHGVDPVAKGWTMPPPDRRPVPFRPTPELVHGVAVSHPELATVLRRAGWFAGKQAQPLRDAIDRVAVRRNEHGFALLASPTEGDVSAPAGDGREEAEDGRVDEPGHAKHNEDGSRVAQR